MRERALVFAALLVWCAALLAVRIERAQSWMYAFLVWNLALAVIPLAASEMLVRARHRGAQAAWLALWMLFLPNAPYIATDLQHLRVRPPVPLWFDVALLISCAATGLLLGYASLATVQSVVAKRFGAIASWFFAAFALGLSAFGIYLGRFLRWNSWDALANPFALLGDVAERLLNPFSHPRMLAVTCIYGMSLILGYMALRTLSASRASDTHRGPSSPPGAPEPPPRSSCAC